MFYWKLVRYKWLYLLLAISFLLLSFYNPVSHYIFFNPNAPDLANFDGVKIRQEILVSGLRVENILFEFNRQSSTLIPLLITLIGYDYASIKDKFIKLSIGKNTAYYQMRKSLKIQLGLVTSLIYLSIFWVVLAISKVLTGSSLEDRHLHGFLDGTFLDHFFSGKITYLVFFSILGAIGIFVNCFVYFKILDVVKNFLRGAGLYLAFLIPLSMLLYYVLPKPLVPFTSLLAITYYEWTLPKVFSIFIPYLISYGVLSYYDRDI